MLPKIIRTGIYRYEGTGVRKTQMATQYRKAYVPVTLDVDKEGAILPRLIWWDNGVIFQIDQILYKCRATSKKIWGGGIRYTVQIRGKGNETIAGILQARKVLIPMAYWREKGLPRGGKVSQPDPYKWCKSTVEKILRQQEYCGDIANFKTYSKSFKNKVRIPNPEESWAVFKNVHEPIIEREVWEQVQQHMQRMPAHMQMWLPPPAFGDGCPPVPVAGISAASV